MRKRKIIYIDLVLMVIVLIASILWIRKINAPEETNVFDEIYRAGAVKFEYVDAPDDIIYISSYVSILSYSVCSLDLVRCDEPVGEWIYRITFNCKELVINVHEIELIVGNNAVSINGESYTTREGVPYEGLIDIFAAKYKWCMTHFDIVRLN